MDSTLDPSVLGFTADGMVFHQRDDIAIGLTSRSLTIPSQTHLSPPTVARRALLGRWADLGDRSLSMDIDDPPVEL